MSMASKSSAHADRGLARRLTDLIPKPTIQSAWLAPRRSIPLAALVIAVVLVALVASQLLLPGVEPLPRNNAIWLDRAWTYGGLESDGLTAAIAELQTHGIGKAYAWVSTLGVDGRWAGGLDGSSFMDARDTVADFAAAVGEADDALTLYAWMEIWTHGDATVGYRLDDDNLHQNIADFSRLLIDQMGFDGLLLDVKPIFSDNGDLISLIRRVRSAIGLETPIAIAVSADLTPHNLRAQNVAAIAPGTMWSDNFKKRVMVSADEVALLLYQSYRQDAGDYIDWVAYHVETYVSLLETATEVYASIPHYAAASQAHNPAVESLPNALDGVKQGLQQLDEESRSLLTGVAIFADRQLGEADWSLFHERWLQA